MSGVGNFSIKQIGSLFKAADLLFVGALFGTVLLLVLPVPSIALDVLLAASIGVSLLMLLIVVYVKDPSEFSGFPTLLLAITLYRLALNVASTRLILIDGFAGEIISSFGNFVVRGNYFVGAVVFLILVVINFMVITKGAGRIAEVAARFTLDAMPGKQMGIDAELNAGIIDEAAAQQRRQKIQREAEFYGAMDGASKFVRGDAVAGILITLINIIGGFAIGVLQKGLPLGQALQKYTLLSIGDGLVAQVPALVVSVGAGILVTRASGDLNLGAHINKQLTLYPRALAIAAVMMGVFSIVPGMPMAPFLLLAAITGGTAYHLIKRRKLEAADAIAAAKKPASSDGDGSTPPARDDFQKLADVNVFSIELGHRLLQMAEKKQGGDLLVRITGVRKSFAREMGMVIPPIAIRDNPELQAEEYRFMLRDKAVAKGQLLPNRWLAMNVANSPVELNGVTTVEPVFGMNAIWIGEDQKQQAEIHGYTVVDATSVLVTHLAESLRRAASLILCRQDVQAMIDHLKQSSPTLVNELIPDLVNVGIIQRVLQNLLREGISIKNLAVIMECIADFAPLTKSPDDLSEQVRRRLGMYFVNQFEAEEGLIKAITLDPRLEQQLIQKIQRNQYEIGLLLEPQMAQYLLAELTRRSNEMADQGLTPLAVTTAELRLAFKRFFEPSLQRLAVLAYQELPAQTNIQSVSIILTPPAARAAA